MAIRYYTFASAEPHFFYEKSPARLYASYMHMVSLPNFQKAVRQERKLATGGGETLTLVDSYT